MVRVFMFALPGLVIAATGTVTQTFEYAQGDFVFDKVDGFDVVALPGHYFTTEPGSPNLPLASYSVLIPPDAEITGVDVVDTSFVTLPGEYSIYPSQRPYVLSRGPAAFVQPDAGVYGSLKAYPAEPVRFTRSGLACGYRIAGVLVAPLSYVPAQKQLRLMTRIEVAIRYERRRHEVLSLDASQVEMMGARARSIVANPEKVTGWAPQVKATDDWLCDMMLITSGGLASSFQSFVDWKTRRGIKSLVVKTESIYSTYPGRDNQERIRNCVRDWWQNHGVKWVLVGGDDGVVPVRTCRITCEGNTEDIATDMYYADLQYSWDSNHNNLFGEMTDSVDLFFDLYIGRTPVDNATDVAVFFAKDTMFEKHQDTMRLKTVLYGSTMLFSPFHGKVINHMIAEIFATGWQNAHLEDPSSGVYADSMDRGFQLAHVAAHGNPTTFSVLSSDEVPGLTNGFTKLNFVNSIACQSGWFDGQECLAEDLVKAANGGCITCMLNTRYGFGYPPAYGPSEMLDLQFYRFLMNGSASQFGALGAMIKDYFQPMVMGQEVWRWCAYELELFGDPTLHAWTARPRTLAVTAPDSALTGPQVLRVSVRDGSTPLNGALVCLAKGSETYTRGWTNSQGWVDLFSSPATTGNLSLSASTNNYYPYDAQVPVRGSASRPALVFAGLRIDDAGGNNNGRLDPGETADLFVSIANAGAANATGVTAKLRTTCTYLTLLDSTSSYGTIAAGDTVEGDRFRVTASASTPPGTPAELVAACTSPQGSWEPYCETRVGVLPSAKKLWADHDTGNMILSVTSLGSVGTLGPYREGSGLKYPRDAAYGSLYFTSLACGNGPNYVVDRWYGHPTSAYQTDWRAVDTLHAVVPPIAADEEYQCMIDDGAHATPKGLTVTQWSGALARDPYRDFVIVAYDVENRGAQPIDGLYVGILSDFDINNIPTSNDAYSDANRRLVYMTQSSFENSAGIKLLSPGTAANLSAIDHAVYVTPGSMMTEAVKDSFLRGAIHVANSNRSANWSCVASAGPFNLAPGARTRVAFAFVGGNSQAEMLVHADSAQSWYDHRMPSGLTYLKSTIDDQPPGGNGDGIINPGEAINLPVWVVNRSDRGATGVRGVLRKTSADTLVTVTDSVRRFGTVGAGDSAFTGANGFKFRVAAACTNRYVLPLTLVCVDTLDSTYASSLPLTVGAPQLVQNGVRCWDPRPGGNNNGRLDPGENDEIALGLQNIGLGNAQNVSARLASGDARLTILDSVGTYGNVPHDSTIYNAGDRFRVLASGAIPPETQIPCTLSITGDGYQATRVFMLAVGALTAVDPIPDGPRTPARYYAYDDVDSMYVSCPEFSWVEINNLGTRLTYSQNDAVVMVNLPTGFGPLKFYGQRYTQVSVSADGWLCPGNYTTSDYSNTGLPDPSTPPGMICVNWDDLHPVSGGGGAGYVYYYHDAANHRFVVEYDSVEYYSGSTRDKFEVVIYDTTRATPTGDNGVLVQYLTANGYTSSTLGIEDPGRTIAIQDLFDGTYHRAAAPIVPGRAILYTTDSVVTGVGEVGSAAGPLRLGLHAAPNPARRAAQLRFDLPRDGRVKLVVLDASGRVVRTLANAVFARGVYTLVWDGRDDKGRTVAGGVYVYRLEAGSDTVVRKAVVLR
jgi:hypothetical protein